MLASIPSSTLDGIDGAAVDVEVHVTNGLPAFTIVGLPDASCREARDRVRAAIESSDFNWPMQRITVNLAPSIPGVQVPFSVTNESHTARKRSRSCEQ